MFEYTKGRFIDAKRIVGMNIYNKDTGSLDDQGQRIIEVRVAIDLDTENKDKASVYAGPFQNEQAAIAFIKSAPINQN